MLADWSLSGLQLLTGLAFVILVIRNVQLPPLLRYQRWLYSCLAVCGLLYVAWAGYACAREAEYASMIAVIPWLLIQLVVLLRVQTAGSVATQDAQALR